MLNSNYAITLGLTASQNKIISVHLKGMECEVIETNSYLDLITSDYFISIINQNQLDENAIRNLSEFYTEIDGNLTENIIIFPSSDALSRALHAQVFKNFDDLEAELDSVLQKAYRKAKKEENTIKNLSYAIIILSQIKMNPGITTVQLSQNINRNSATVRRYIEALCVMGESIEYNAETKGWKLQNGQSLLIGDFE